MTEAKLYQRGKFDYSSLPGINITSLKELARSPLHYRHRLENPRAATKSLELGTVSHVAVLEPEQFLREYVLWDAKTDDGEKTKPRRGKAWEAFQEQHAGKKIIRSDEYDVAISLRDAVRADPVAMKYLAMGRPEVAMTWTDEHTGLACKGRVDWVTHVEGIDCIVDLKGTRNASPSSFARDCARLNYHLQLAFYADGYEQATGKTPRVVVVAVEFEPPHDVVTYIVPAEVTELGQDEYRKLLERYSECAGNKSWPGCGDGAEKILQLPAWATPTDEDISDLDLDWSGHEQKAS
jgi:hypothetical protein